jgi:lipid-binding SYLF domain-containing protein
MQLQAKRAVPYLLLCVVLILSTMPVWGASKADDDKTILNAVTVLQAMVHSKDIPSSVLAKADCVVVLPSVKKFAVGIGGTGGRGPMSCRTGKGFSGKWSTPAMYSIGGASAGLQLGGTSTDIVLLIMSPTAADKVMNGKVKVGTDATAAAGPGASTTMSNADILTYSRTKGLFAGVSLDGATLDPDGDANGRLYGQGVSAQSVITGTSVKATPAGQSFSSVLNQNAAKHM